MRPPPPALSEVLTAHEVRAIVRRVPTDGTPEASLGLGPGTREDAVKVTPATATAVRTRGVPLGVAGGGASLHAFADLVVALVVTPPAMARVVGVAVVCGDAPRDAAELAEMIGDGWLTDEELGRRLKPSSIHPALAAHEALTSDLVTLSPCHASAGTLIHRDHAAEAWIGPTLRRRRETGQTYLAALGLSAARLPRVGGHSRVAGGHPRLASSWVEAPLEISEMGGGRHGTGLAEARDRVAARGRVVALMRELGGHDLARRFEAANDP